MNTLKQQVDEILASKFTAATKKKKLQALGLTDTNIRELMHSLKLKEKHQAEPATTPAPQEEKAPTPKKPSSLKPKATTEKPKKEPKTAPKNPEAPKAEPAPTPKKINPKKLLKLNGVDLGLMTFTSSGDEAPLFPTRQIGEALPPPTKENTLYLTIKQVYFDQIVAGTKVHEYREITESTTKRYLEYSDEGSPIIWIDVVTCPKSDVKEYTIDVYNNGIYPYFPKETIKYLKLAVGYQKQRDTAIVEVTGIHFEPHYNKDGKAIRFSYNPPDGSDRPDPNGPICYWQIVFHLGKVVELHRK